jgi:HSP20 family protein
LSERWWRRKKRPWFDVYDEFDRFERMMDDMTRRAFVTPSQRENFRRPYVYGFSMSVGPDGKPVIRKFGNVQPSHGGPRIREEREPLVDVMDDDKDVIILAELPGVEKNDINIQATESYLTISVDAAERKYHKELILPATVDPKSSKASYKNGVLEVRLKKLAEKTAKGERILME